MPCSGAAIVDDRQFIRARLPIIVPTITPTESAPELIGYGEQTRWASGTSRNLRRKMWH